MCGKGCVTELLHITTDYEVTPLPCAPELVEALKLSHSLQAGAALHAGRPFGLTLPECTSATDIFVPMGEDGYGTPVYSGVQRGERMFRCLTDGPETWAIAPSSSSDGPAECGGRVRLDINASQAFMSMTDAGACSGAEGGVRFDSGLSVCSIANLHNLVDDSELVADSAMHIACALVRSFGTHTVRDLDATRSAATSESVPGTNITVRLAHTTGAVRLLGDLVVRQGESLRLEADDAASLATVVVGAQQLRVEAGGTLELVRVKLTRSTGSVAMRISGLVVAFDGTFSDCVTGVDLISRYMEPTVLPGPDGFPARGAALVAAGGVALVWLSHASLSLTRCVLEGNVAQGPAVSAFGGAILSVGAQVTVEAGTAFRNNSAVGCNTYYGAFGGAIASVLSRLSVSDSEFSSNSAGDSQSCSGVTKFAQGGGLYILRPLAAAIVHATRFEANVVSGGRFSIGGAIRLHDGTHLTLRDSVLRQNVAQNGRQAVGGAVGLDVASAVLSASNTTFEDNAARGGSLYTRGGALYVEKGRAEIGHAVVFRSNIVSSSSDAGGSVGGGAVALTTAASLTAPEVPVFDANQATGPEPRGGALFVDASFAIIANGVFEANNVTVLFGEGYGGASPRAPLRHISTMQEHIPQFPSHQRARRRGLCRGCASGTA